MNKSSAPAKPAYHHGDLRMSAIDIGLTLLNQDKPLSLRDIARRANVSATAMYRHFPDKNALLSALAIEGMNRLAQIQAKAAKNNGGGLDGFRAMGIAYVKFAIENPALFRLIFNQAPKADPLKAGIDAVGPAMRGLRENITALLPSGWDDKHRSTAALHAWSIVHGLAMLILDKQIEYDPKTIEAVVTATTIMTDSPIDSWT